MTSMIGVMQFVVQLAQEMMLGVPPAHSRHGRRSPPLRRSTAPTGGRTVRLPGCASPDRRAARTSRYTRTPGRRPAPPGELRWIAAPQRAQLAAGDDQVGSVDDHGLRVASVNCVEAEQVGEVLDLDQIVDGDQLEGRVVDHQLEDRTSDPSKAVDGDSGAHAAVLFTVRFSLPSSDESQPQAGFCGMKTS